MDDNTNKPTDKLQNNELKDSSELSIEDDTDNSITNDTSPDINGQSQQVMTLLQVESAIKTRIAQIERIRDEAKPLKEMLETFLANDESYIQLSEVAKEAGKKKNARKKDLLKTENGQQLVDKLNQLKDHKNEFQESLSYFLREFQRLTGANEIEGEDGELRQIVYSAKLVRKTNLK